MGLRGDGAGGGPSVRGSRPARTGRAPRRARGEGARRGGQGARWLDAEAAPRDPSSAARDPSAVTWSHRRYLNGPGRPPISGFGFAPSSGPNSQGEGALRSGARVPTYVHCACGAPSPEARGRRPPCTPSSVLDFVHLGSMGAPLRCSRKPRRWRRAAELDGRRPRLRYLFTRGRRGAPRGCAPRCASSSYPLSLPSRRAAASGAGCSCGCPR